MSSKGKSKRVEQEDPDLDDEVPAPAASKKKEAPPKKKKKPTQPDPEPEEEAENMDEEEPDEEVMSEEQMAKRKAALSKKRKKAKLVGYRTLAKTAGYVDVPASEGIVPAGADCISSLLSVADSKRLMRFVPATPGAPGFDAEEFGKRLDLFKQSVPSSAARETQARCDAVLRSAMNQVVQRAVDTGKKTISASMMASVLRPYAANMEFTCVTPPLGLVRYSQNVGILNFPENDISADEKKECKANLKAYNEFIEAEDKRKQERKSAIAMKKDKAAKAAAAGATR